MCEVRIRSVQCRVDVELTGGEFREGRGGALELKHSQLKIFFLTINHLDFRYHVEN